MTAKEKAKALVAKFEKTIFGYDVFDEDWIQCIECAIIAVEEIIKETDTYYDSLIASERKLYWQQVKTEIENL